MSTSKHIDKICIAAIILMLIITTLFMCGESLGITASTISMPYEQTFFDSSYVHTVDIVMNDWDSFIEDCESEEYAPCTVVIDGEKYSNIAIRAKGNTSLSTVSSLDSDRYSFKLEFDHYEDGKSLDGLDKLCLNNLIQDNTMMKDYIVYKMMNEFGVDSPLCSYAYLTVNGEDWGLYLAVEGIEDSFLERNYDSTEGDLYKPDSMSFGGGRGNGKDFDIGDFDFTGQSNDDSDSNNMAIPSLPNGTQSLDENFDFSSQGDTNFNMPSMPNQIGENKDFNFESSNQGDTNFPSLDNQNTTDNNSDKQGSNKGISMGSDDVKLQYIDDDPDSYSNIFDNAKTDVDDSDKERLINSLKNLNSYSDLENTVDIDEVMRYFVIHNFVCNGDSYTGSMIHNYYLYEEDGILSMIPWDYNLAFGTFQGNDASGTINTSIDDPVSGGDVDDRPMLGWIFSSEEYTSQYHELFKEFISEWIDSGKLKELISDTKEMISSYVEKDPTKFCTLEEFEEGVSTLETFVQLRGEAVTKQLSGDSTKVDTSNLDLSSMGTMNNSNGGDKNMEIPSNNIFDMSQFSLMSFVSLIDEDGKQIDINEVIPEDVTITSINLSDDTSIDLTDLNMQDLMQLDMSKIISVTDSNGNIYDLSSYTISTASPNINSANEDMNAGSLPSSQDASMPNNIPGNMNQMMPGQDNRSSSDMNNMPQNNDIMDSSNYSDQTMPNNDSTSENKMMPNQNNNSSIMGNMPQNDDDNGQSNYSEQTTPNEDLKAEDHQMTMLDNFNSNGINNTTNIESLVLVVASIVILLIGIIVAKKVNYRR